MDQASDFAQGQLHVRREDNRDSVEISFFLDGVHNLLNRPKSEMIGKGLARLQKNIEKKRNKALNAARKKQKKKNKMEKIPKEDHELQGANEFQSQGEGLQMWLRMKESDDNVNLDNELLTHETGWQDGQVFCLGGSKFDVVINPPKILDLHVPGKSALMCNYEIWPEVSTEFAESVLYKWYRKSTCSELADYVQVSESQCYTPTQEDANASSLHPEDCLLLECTPLSAGGKTGRVVRAALGPVRPEAIPKLEALRSSALGAGAAPAGGLRAVSYNVLADPYATTDFCRNVLYPYVAPHALALDYRMALAGRELLATHADLLLLQECDLKAFHKLLGPQLERNGFQGLHKSKCGQADEGCATFFKRSRFTLESVHDINLKDEYEKLPELAPLLAAVPAVRDLIREKITTIAQITVLRPTAQEEEGDVPSSSLQRRLIAANTHLFFHPDASCIRLLQGYVILRHLERLKGDLAAQGLRVSVVLAGDLNSSTRGALYQLLATGAVLPGAHVWSKLQDFRWGKRGEFWETEDKEHEGAEVVDRCSTVTDDEASKRGANSSKDASLTKKGSSNDNATSPFTETAVPPEEKVEVPPGAVPALRHALGLLDACPGNAFTNCSSTFVDTLDYLFVDAATLEVVRPFPMPTLEEARAHTALPSVEFPSDHVSIGAELRFR